MSGIYIENAKLPGQGDDLIIFDNGSVWTTKRPKRGYFRIDGAKAVEVPDHGALIERDKILDVWKSDPHPASMKTLVQAIWKTPIVLQADVAKDNNAPDKEARIFQSTEPFDDEADEGDEEADT